MRTLQVKVKPSSRQALFEQQPDGTWLELHGRHTMEFRAYAARPQATIRREFATPVAGPLGAYARAASENVPATRPLRRCSRLALQELVPLRRPFRASTSWSLHATLPLAL